MTQNQKRSLISFLLAGVFLITGVLLSVYLSKASPEDQIKKTQLFKNAKLYKRFSGRGGGIIIPESYDEFKKHKTGRIVAVYGKNMRKVEIKYYYFDGFFYVFTQTTKVSEIPSKNEIKKMALIKADDFFVRSYPYEDPIKEINQTWNDFKSSFKEGDKIIAFYSSLPSRIIYYRFSEGFRYRAEKMIVLPKSKFGFKWQAQVNQKDIGWCQIEYQAVKKDYILLFIIVLFALIFASIAFGIFLRLED